MTFFNELKFTIQFTSIKSVMYGWSSMRMPATLLPGATPTPHTSLSRAAEISPAQDDYEHISIIV
jgi:hypothetical protein